MQVGFRRLILLAAGAAAGGLLLGCSAPDEPVEPVELEEATPGEAVAPVQLEEAPVTPAVELEEAPVTPAVELEDAVDSVDAPDAVKLEEAAVSPATRLELPENASPLEVGKAFLEKNGEREGVVTTASGLQYEVLAAGGEGPSPKPTDRVSAHYHGTLIDGRVFDSSVQRGEPFTASVNGVIKGWQEALQLMRAGDKWKLFIPPELAYGEKGSGATIGPNETLVFEVELLAIEGA